MTQHQYSQKCDVPSKVPLAISAMRDPVSSILNTFSTDRPCSGSTSTCSCPHTHTNKPSQANQKDAPQDPTRIPFRSHIAVSCMRGPMFE